MEQSKQPSYDIEVGDEGWPPEDKTVNWLVKWWRIIRFRCPDCGGKLWCYDSKRFYCRDCDKRV